MPLDPQLVLFSVNGVQVQIELARGLMVKDGYPTLAIDAVAASVATLQALVEQAQPVQAKESVCSHPIEKRQRTDMPGGNWYDTCGVCGDLVDQSSDTEMAPVS